MSGIADSVRIAQDKDGMLRRALERIIQLYTDKSHFVYELLQNAEDSEAKSIRFIQFADRLEVLHDGKPFTMANLEGLCDIGKSDKVDNLNQIGEFGVGFKSVFGICETVKLYSTPKNYQGNADLGDAVPFAVEIKDFVRPEDIEEEEVPGSYTTRFVFPYAVGHSFSGFQNKEELINTLSRKLSNLGITTLLFMKHLELIEYQALTKEKVITGKYLLGKRQISDHCTKVAAIGESEKVGDKNDSNDVVSFLMFSRKLERFPQRTVDIAFPVVEEDGEYQCVRFNNPYVSVYFPTETESKLDFIVQGPYRTTPNRSSIPADDSDNVYIAQETALLLRDSLIELKESGQLNMSFVRAIPLIEERFETYGLFRPLYGVIEKLFSNAAIIPSKSGQYVAAKNARIARQERLATVFTDELLTDLIGDGSMYYWLPTTLTETNRDYKHVLDYMNGVLHVPVIRPEDTRSLFANNPRFLPKQSIDWLVKLYNIYENVPRTFSRTNPDANMATAVFVRTADGRFVAPYRKEGKTYIPNVFIPVGNICNSDVNFVDPSLYSRCKYFFDSVLGLQRPNEYELFIKDIRRRYKDGVGFDENQHFEDIKTLLKFLKREEYVEEVRKVVKDILCLKCTDGRLHNASQSRVFIPVGDWGINLEGYYRNLGQNVFFVDADFYSSRGLEVERLKEFGVRSSISIGEGTTNGVYDVGPARGRQPEWWTPGEFRWKLSMDALKEAIQYISKHPTANDSILKSKAIVTFLVSNDNKLCGSVHIGGSTPNLENEPCEMIHILRGERTLGWDGKWLFTDSGERVAPKEISKYDISSSIYGKISQDATFLQLLRFRKTENDVVDELKKSISKDKLDAYFESELRRRYGLSAFELNAKYGNSNRTDGESNENEQLSFPVMNVKNLDALKKHAEEMLVYADPVRYEERVRSIRVSNHSQEARAYLMNMYRYEGDHRFKYACQLCHEACGNFEVTELFLKPETELDPVNLCLCPNCATAYRNMRNQLNLKEKIRRRIVEKSDSDLTSEDYVAIPLDDDDALWFTQTHFAEVRELLRLMDEAKRTNVNKAQQQAQTTSQSVAKPIENSNRPSNNVNATRMDASTASNRGTLSVYASYKGKKLRRKDGFVGIVTDVDNSYLTVHVIGGKDAGKDTKISLSFVLKNKNIYTFLD